MTQAATRLQVLPRRYVDSVVQLAATRAMRAADGVAWAAAGMGTPANLELLADEGFGAVEAGPADLVLAVRAGTDEEAGGALAAGEAALGATTTAATAPSAVRPPRDVTEALAREGSANVAIVSVPGEYAALEAHKALSAGLHVLLFSDGVTVADEVELKRRAIAEGLLLMGPGAGTAILGGAGLGFANVVRRGRVGVAAAAGTGAQEVAALLDRWGVGVSHVIGLGGRDLKSEVGGLMAAAAMRALAADPGTDVVLLVTKPTDPAVAAAVAESTGDVPLVTALVGAQSPPSTNAVPGQGVARVGDFSFPTLEDAAVAAARLAGAEVPDLVGDLRVQVAAAASTLDARRTLVRGLYSGGTLCSEALTVLGRHLGAVHSNIPLRPDLGLPAPNGAHVCLDLGEEEFTRGRPHPMIDPAARLEELRALADDPCLAVVLVDVVLGHGAHADPASELSPVLAQLVDAGIAVVAYVLGTDADPQGLRTQRATLRAAGCVLPLTHARAALAAAAIALRRPELVDGPP